MDFKGENKHRGSAGSAGGHRTGRTIIIPLHKCDVREQGGWGGGNVWVVDRGGGGGEERERKRRRQRERKRERDAGGMNPTLVVVLGGGACVPPADGPLCGMGSGCSEFSLCLPWPVLYHTLHLCVSAHPFPSASTPSSCCVRCCFVSQCASRFC